MRTVKSHRAVWGRGATATGVLSVRLVLEGPVQDGPFLQAFSREAARGSASVRRWGSGLEVRVSTPTARTRTQALSKARALVARAARVARCEVHVLSARADERDDPPPPGVRVEEALATAGGAEGVPRGAVPRDKAPCPDCVRESSRAGRHHHYMRTECLACGPRFAAARGLPLGREAYGLASFEPCHACRAEAGHAGGRRFAFERVSCATCGPTLTLLHPSGPPTLRDPLGAAARLLAGGRPVALNTPYGGVVVSTPEGVGGLRVALGDEFRPLTLLVATLAAARQVAPLTATEAATLASPEAPEVLVEPRGRGRRLLAEASPFEPRLRLRLPDSLMLHEIARRAGPLLTAGAARGGGPWPSGPRDATALTGVPWLWDGVAVVTPLPPARVYMLGRQRVFLAHGRGSLPAQAPVPHEATVLAAGGGAELFGAVAHDGSAHFTGSAGPARRTDAAARLRSLVSHAAALSPSAHAERVDAVASAAAEGSASRFAMEEVAESTGALFVPVTPLRARVHSARAGDPRPPPVLVLEAEEDAGPDAERWGTQHTGGELMDPAGSRVVGGVAPYEVVESPGGRVDLVAPLASLFARAGAPLGRSPAEDEPILRVLRKRAQKSTSAVALADGVAAALGVVPRRAPPGSGLMELTKHLERPEAARRFRMEAPLVRARGSRQVDALGLLTAFAREREGAMKRAGRALPLETRAALGASFVRALIGGVVASCASARPRPGRVVVTGSFLQSPPAARALLAAFGRRHIKAGFPTQVPVLDGALAYGACAYAGTLLT